MKLRLAIALLLSSAAPTLADPAPSVPQRVDRLEKEMKAVQRKVFPGGSPAFFEPEIQRADTPAAPAGSPATAPLNELTGRVDALEKALSQVTSQNEELQHRLQIVSESAAKDRNEFDTRLKALEASAAPAPAPAATADAAPIRPAKGRPVKLVPADADAPPPAADAKPAKLAAADKAPVKPAKEDSTPAPAASGDPAEDAYMAGYKLWADKKYADAELALAEVAKKYPKHKRASYARNLKGRAELDEGKPATAAQTFLANYQSDPHGERAPDSLFYLGVALTQLKKTDNACRAYGELEDVYGSTMGDSIKAKLPAAKKAAQCK